MSTGTLEVILALVISVVLHELAHGAVARLLGDTTAERAGRLTLNPLKHIDPFGSILFPLILAVGQLTTIGHVAFMYGWARPVPVNPMELRLNGARHPRQLMAVVAAAGPLMNFALAVLGGFLLNAGHSVDFLVYFIEINLVLGLFNLFPMPPMDGGRIAVGVLPLPAARWLAGFERQGIILVLLVIFILPLVLAQFGLRFDPFQEAMGRILPWAEQIILQITGHGSGN
ncbi:site-2 protease family protein [Acidocella sp.]|uniref:site-2 protease family protein n=1 Tax=Acidocella sp. TaxID=50710 RepID=UPI00261F351A|nr:site-2 protease family protein [Acidocella sp.]MDD2794483.1 site-2 protease family protein [Acidocella sp.]